MNKYLKPEDIEFALANIPQLTFEVTDACNLKCTYCGYGEFYEDYDIRENKLLEVKKAVKIIDYLAKYWNSDKNMSIGSNVYISFYGGEPLLNMSFIKSVVNHIKNLDCPYRKFSFSMTTNGILLHRHMDYLYENDFNLLISLDGNKENTAYRVDKVGNNAFDRIAANVDALKEKYSAYFNSNVNFNAVLHNKNSVEEIYHFFKDKYGKIPSIGELNSTGIRKDKQEEFKKTYRNSAESLQQAEHYEEIERDMFINTATYQSVNLYLHQYSGFVFNDYTDLLFEKKDNFIPTGTCTPFAKKMFITVNGKILPCERIGHQYALGEINSEVVLDINHIARKYNTYYAKLEKQCTQCKNVKGCVQCMFNMENLEEKPVCYGFMNNTAFRNYVNTQMRFLEKNPEAYFRLMTEVIVE